jgi:hypothetical protein
MSVDATMVAGPNIRESTAQGISTTTKTNEVALRRLAEAMTEAKVRKCPSCETEYLKASGCNKMKCPVCKTYMCYICRLPVPKDGYGESSNYLLRTIQIVIYMNASAYPHCAPFSQITFVNIRTIVAENVAFVPCGHGTTIP